MSVVIVPRKVVYQRIESDFSYRGWGRVASYQRVTVVSRRVCKHGNLHIAKFNFTIIAVFIRGLRSVTVPPRR